jgi:hypothetical protein
VHHSLYAHKDKPNYARIHNTSVIWFTFMRVKAIAIRSILLLQYESSQHSLSHSMENRTQRAQCCTCSCPNKNCPRLGFAFPERYNVSSANCVPVRYRHGDILVYSRTSWGCRRASCRNNSCYLRTSVRCSPSHRPPPNRHQCVPQVPQVRALLIFIPQAILTCPVCSILARPSQKSSPRTWSRNNKYFSKMVDPDNPDHTNRFLVVGLPNDTGVSFP